MTLLIDALLPRSSARQDDRGPTFENLRNYMYASALFMVC